jgi:adenine-specific DNA-methyltransferase
VPHKPQESESYETQTLADRRREEIRALIPEAFDANGGFDSDALKLAIGIDPERVEKRFGLVWPGKEKAAAMVNAPHQWHLYPDRDASVEFDTTKNAFIEADNLAALRLMQNAYQGQVKLIYIDPPYNTGNDFVYKDNFEDGLEAYLSQCEINDEGGRRTKSKSTAEAGRKHSTWLNFMYPRLRLAHRLLRRDGTIVVACDDNEFANLRLMMNEIFGEENFVATLIWQGGRKNDSRFVSVGHDYMIVFAKDAHHLKEFTSGWHVRKQGLEAIYEEVDRIVADVKVNHRSDWSVATKLLKQWFKNLDGTHPAKNHAHYNHIDGHGDRGHVFFPSDATAPGGRKIDLIDKRTGDIFSRSGKRGWGFSQEEFDRLVAEDRILLGPDSTSTPKPKSYLQDTELWAMSSVFYQDRRSASKRLKSLMGEAYFDYPKDEIVLSHIIEAMSDDNDIIMDFFGGSGSTGHAVWLQNAKDGKERRFVVCTLPEVLAEKTEASKAGYKVISQITIDRLHLASKKVQKDHPKWAGDAGFRVFRLAGKGKPSTETKTFDLLDPDGMMAAFEYQQKAASERVAHLDQMIPHYICRFSMEAGYRLDARLEDAGGDVWKISQDHRQGWIVIPRTSGSLRERICAAGAKQGDEVILVERSVSDSDIANCSAFFELTTKRL